MKLYTAKNIAKFLDISERRVRQLKDEKVIIEVRPGLYDLIETNHRYINYLRQRNQNGEEQLDYQTERARLIKAKRQNEELELQQKESKLHKSEDIENVMSAMLINFKTRLMCIPSKLSPVLSTKTDKNEIYKMLKQNVDEALTELSDFKTAFKEFQKETEEKENGKDKNENS